ncbi:hypothetical protein FE257_009075 [Aspergillus nanangensis]|uniref:Major facilitator superfamily (MFS) profile domain-containing protein n=1 Tax=Aspergillus nanangensis TaxID=2582783 RepID=A0AAD4GYK8_ASPNN|nr:hypothetical protein FE257_009075 [Aspergillus nanangensis]
MTVVHEITQHSTIGPIRGIKHPSGVIQYLGIQYATLNDRFSRGELRKQYNLAGRELNATELGPIPLSPLNGCEWEQKLIQKSLPFPDYPQSDTECLTLNIARPVVKDSQTLPVLVLVHGGAFATGSSAYPQYDLARITKQSVDMGMPLVAVSVNYRLGAPGFLHSVAMKSAGYKPNNGLNDQRLALQWIRHHIAGFGGDAERVTFIGESAGGACEASGCFHLHSSEPLFHQLIAMSGTSLLRPRSPELLEKSFGRVVEALGLQHHSPEEQVQRLSRVSMDELREKAGRQIPLGPMIDGDIIPRATTYPDLGDQEASELFPGIHHCKRILMGDCQSDSLVFASRLGARTDIFPKTLVQNLSTILDPIDATLTPAIVTAYGLDPSIPANTPESTEKVLELGNDICFTEPSRFFTRAWSGSSVVDTEALLYHFNCPNPWDGPFKGRAIHIQDIAYALLNYQDHLAPGQQQSAARFAEDIIAFTNGRSPWARGAMVYYASVEGEQDESKFVSDVTPEHTGRRDILQSIVSVGLLDKVMDAWQMFMAGPRTWVVVLFSTSYTASVPRMSEYFDTSKTVMTLGVTCYLIGMAVGVLIMAPLSELWGRWPIFLVNALCFTVMFLPSALATSAAGLIVVRFFSGLFGSAFVANSPGVIADMIDGEYRALAISIWSLGPLNGPVSGPIIGGFVTEYLGWRWSNWVVMMLSGLSLAGACLLRETYTPFLLRQKAKAKRKETGDDRWWSDYDSPLQFVALLSSNLVRPLHMAVSEPICLFWNLYIGIVYGILYLCFVAYPIVFSDIRGWSTGLSGLAFIGIGIGTVLVVLAEPLCRRLIQLHPVDEKTGQRAPEAAVCIICTASILIPAGQLWFAWTGSPASIHWVVPLLAGVPFGAGNTATFIYISNYITDSYGIYAASALAGNTVVRNIMGGCLPLAGTPMYRAMGPNWAGTLLGLLEVAIIPIPFVFYKYGHLIRRRSPMIQPGPG